MDYISVRGGDEVWSSVGSRFLYEQLLRGGNGVITPTEWSKKRQPGFNVGITPVNVHRGTA